MPRKDIVIRGAGVLIVAGVLAGGGSYVVGDGGGGGDPDTANIWVDTSGGTCVDNSSLVEWTDANACASFDAAWDAAEAGDLIRVKDGSYNQQEITGDKASTTKIIGESKAGVIVTNTSGGCAVTGEYGAADDGALCFHGDNTWIENVTADAAANDSVGGGIRSYRTASNVTLKNVDVIGDWPTNYITGPGFTWDGGSHGEDGTTTEHLCSMAGSQPNQLEDLADDATFANLRINPFVQIPGAPSSSCDAFGNFHLEWLRVQGAQNNTVLRNNYWVDGSGFGSGMVFWSGGGSSTGVKFINNRFAHNDAGKWLDANPATPCTIQFLYNTWAADVDAGPADYCGTSAVWVGNLGPDAAFAGCDGTHTKNVRTGSGSCGTDTYIGAASLGLDSDLKLQAGSPAIDAAETPGASDYCTDAATVNSLDFEGTVRPQGSVCDAGADER